MAIRTPSKPSDDEPVTPTWREREDQFQRVRATADKISEWLSKRKRPGLMVAALLLLAAPVHAELEACFTPGEDCTGLIVREIGAAKREFLIQSYSFTSAPIAKALSDAKTRGVDVRVILDKSNEAANYSGATFLALAGVPVLIDDRVAIAHNKLIIIDRETTSPAFLLVG